MTIARRGAPSPPRSGKPASIRPSSTRGFSSATRSASITRRLPPTPTGARSPPRCAAIAALATRRLAARAGRAHHRRQGVLGPGADASPPRRWCRGRRPRPWSKRRSPRSTRGGPRDAPAAHRRSRHRLRRAAARAALRTAERARHRHRHQPRGAGDGARQCRGGSASLARAHFVACDFGAALARRLRSRGVQSALRRERRHRRARARSAARSARARSTAAPTGSPAIAPSPPTRDADSCADGHLVVELGIGQERDGHRAVSGSGTCARAAAPRSRRHSARAARHVLPQ